MTETISFYPAEPFTVLPGIPDGPVHELVTIPLFAITSDITAEDFAVTMASLGTRHDSPCLAVRWLSTGTSFGVIQFCELEYHMDVHAHRMTNPDGSVTTWRR